LSRDDRKRVIVTLRNRSLKTTGKRASGVSRRVREKEKTSSGARVRKKK